MPTTIDELEIKVSNQSIDASSGIDSLVSSLEKLKVATHGGVGLTSVINQISKLNNSLSGIGDSASKIDTLSASLEKLKSIGSFKISSSIGNQIKNISEAFNGINVSDFDKVTQLSTALSGLNSVEKATGLTSTINQLKKIPELAETLNAVDWGTFVSNINRLTESLTPLTNGLNSAAASFRSLPTDVKKLETALTRQSRTNEEHAKSYVNILAKIRLFTSAIKGVVHGLASVITVSNTYVEDLNLFTISLGEYASEAKKYADNVSEVLGINPAEWMRNQGVFNNIINGFGVASDRAYLMSKNLTQLGYDISSFYNLPVEEAMTKLTSGISGELEPLRRLGYDLSTTRLQQEALNLGITQSVSSMSQAEKAQLRYYAIMTQVTTAQGDMARTLNAPANQLRVLRAQFTMCAQSIGNIFIPALNAILPVAIAVVQVIRGIADTIAGLFGYTIPTIDTSGITVGSSAVGGLADNADDATSGLNGASDAAKKLKNNLLGIDELNIISPDNGSSGGSGSGSGSGSGIGGSAFDFALPEYDFLQGLVENRANELTKMIEDSLAEIEGVASGYMLGLGAILTLSGANIPLGVALMAAGALGLGHVAISNWDAMDTKLATCLEVITSTVSGFFVAVGSILLFTGVDVPLGIGMLAAGIASGGLAVAINWNFLDNKIEGSLTSIAGIVSGALLGVGALLAVTGVNVPLGIALIASGAIGLGTTAVIKWDFLSDEMKAKIGEIEALVGGAVLGVGAILALTGANIPLGLGLIAAGAVSMGSSAALNWGAVSQTLFDTLKYCGTIIGGLLLPLGVIMLLSGVGIPIGIGMILAGGASFGAGIALNWGSIVETVKEGLGRIADLFDDLKDKVSEKIEGFAKIGEDIIKGIEKGINDFFSDPLKWVEDNIVNPFLAAVKSLLGIKSPSTVMAEIGGYTIEGFLNGILEPLKNIKTWVQNNIITPIVNALKKNPLPDAEIAVGLVKDGWNSVNEWIGSIPVLSQAIALSKNGWTTVAGWIGTLSAVRQGVTLVKTGWESVKKWLGDIPVVTQGVSLAKSGWESIKGWIGNIPVVDQAIGLVKSGWESVKGWIGNIPTVSQGVGLSKSGWTTVKDWIGSTPVISQPVSLSKSGWSKVSDFIGTTSNVAISLSKSGWSNIKSYVGDKVTVGIALEKDGWTDLKTYFKLNQGGVLESSKGYTANLKARGGVFEDGIPMYANGTSKIHGSLFVAGEAGAEMVGHIGGRTEVLNRFQLAQVMNHSIVSGMAQFTGYWQTMINVIADCTTAIVNGVSYNTEALYSLSNDEAVGYMTLEGKTSYQPYESVKTDSYEDDSTYRNLVSFYTQYLEPVLKEIASETKRNADKDYTPVVTISSRDVKNAVVRQTKADGYSFT